MSNTPLVNTGGREIRCTREANATGLAILLSKEGAAIGTAYQIRGLRILGLEHAIAACLLGRVEGRVRIAHHLRPARLVRLHRRDAGRERDRAQRLALELERERLHGMAD